MFFPASVTPDAKRLILTRAVRGLGDGFVSVYLAAYLELLRFSAFQIGAIVTAMLVGSAVFTLLAGLASHKISTRRVLFVAALLMGFTGAGFASLSGFWLLFFVAFVGTLNPSAGDVSVFLPTEQAILAGEASSRDRTALFARYTLGGSLFGAVWGIDEWIARGCCASPGLDSAGCLPRGFRVLHAARTGYCRNLRPVGTRQLADRNQRQYTTSEIPDGCGASDDIVRPRCIWRRFCR
jgi:MFS family permease